MTKTTSYYSWLSKHTNFAGPGVVSLVWLVELCLATLAVFSLSACNNLPSTPSAIHRRPTLTPSLSSSVDPTPASTPTKILSPTLTLAPTPTPCVYDAELDEVRDPYKYWYVNSYPTFDLVLRNSGTCPWPEATRLVLFSENPLGWPESWSVGAVGVGDTAGIRVKLMAPSTPQTLFIIWQLEGQEGLLIGPAITHTLRVGQPAPRLLKPQSSEVVTTGTVRFGWSGILEYGQSFRVIVFYVPSGQVFVSPDLTDHTWTTELSFEHSGEYRWRVVIVQGDNIVASSGNRSLWFVPFQTAPSSLPNG